MRNAILNFLLFGVLVLSSAFIGCAGPKPAGEPLVAPGDLMYEDLDTKERFRKYNSVGIKPFGTDGVVFLSTDAEEQAEMESFTREANTFMLKGFNNEMEDNYYKKFGVIDDAAEEQEYDLVIEGRFIEFDRGNAAGRFWGTGGATRVSVEGTMTERATGKVVVKFRDAKIGTGSMASIFLLQQNCWEIGANVSDFLEEVY